ncbi:hypothetical protein PF005_g23099 [Phytophthora fragariae]|uniref:Temptin Cys/Cys disulfide domain-containing protein n=1 Tax=Phytophthora fragariae TaxID=53985 RepID=A0A6A3QPL1_9STRA|nr:hypothetical protein PF003_g21780 [Phytophthora fragariae]KAE8925828.1 hypothetical protein PF009_g23967 [Phytophthora fragariae]KAE8982019.1 hypothetical protein PF011_g21794 [Phytophthora fragariae]KAE9079955.1 hypothetical protein PF007_g23233 [Phytophthora fragariae]KAE9080192.1 hypothetical protein PF010_g22470 [Phytophthora fragariae]
MVSGSLVLIGGMTLLVSTTQGYGYYVPRIPNADNVDGYNCIGHTSDNGHKPPNAFGKAFENAGNEWTVALCQADADGDGQTNGQELGDPCCVWTESSGDAPRWTTGVSHPSDATLKSDPSLWANINCNADKRILCGDRGELHRDTDYDHDHGTDHDHEHYDGHRHLRR